jgi:hypothetical protein
MKLATPLLASVAAGAAIAAGALGLGASAASPAGAARAPTVTLAATAAAATSPAPSSGAVVTVPPTRCETQEWPDAATGQPAGLMMGGATGFYLWHNAEGWHLEATHPTTDHMVFSGWFSSNGTIAFKRVDDEHNDLTREGPGDHVLSFVFNNYGGVDGLHFETHCADWLQFHLFINGSPAGVERVYVGHTSVHPLAMPFTIDRAGVH